MNHEESRGGPHRPSRPHPGASPERPGADDDAPALQGLEALQRLRDRVERAAHELRRLREENATLAARLRELEARPDRGPALLDKDPEVLRRKITGFIEAIDHYLEQGQGQE